MRRIGLVLTSALLTAAIACGGDDAPGQSASPAPTTTSAAPTTPAGMTKAEYVAAVNKVCKEAEKASGEIDEPKTADDYFKAVSKISQVFEDAQKELRTLTPPAADAAEVEEKFLSVNDEQSKILKGVLPKLKAAAAKDDKSAAENAFLEAITKLGQLSEEQDEFSKSYGLTACAS